jgi:hypothetical protein
VASLLRFAAFAVVVVGLLVFLVVPVLASPVLTQMVREMGLEADDLDVSIEYFDPSLFAGRTDSLRIRASNASIPPATVGTLDVTFGDVSFVDRTFETVRGELGDVVVVASGLSFSVDSIQVGGPANAALATGRLTEAQSEDLVRAAAQRVGVVLDDVRFVGDGLRIRTGDRETPARLAVRGGALVLELDAGPPVLLLQPAPADPWRLTEAYVTERGITIAGLVDAMRLAQRIGAMP